MLNYFEFYKSLSMHDEPPTLYSFMESIVNYSKSPDEKVKIKDLPANARSKIFNFDYPVSPLFGKENFETLFLKHFMFRRINFDTFTSFQIHLDVKLNEIMPKYNKLIDGFDRLNFDGDVETHTRTQEDVNNMTSSNTNQNNVNSDVRYSNTPEGELEAVKDGTYLSEYTYNQNESEGHTSTEGSSTNNTSENIEIKRVDHIDEYKKFLEVYNNIYEMIFKECESLFYGII